MIKTLIRSLFALALLCAPAHAAILANIACMSSVTTGTGSPITLGSAVSGYVTFANAGVVDGQVVSYSIVDGASTEVGTGTYTASGTTLTRTVNTSTNSNSAINLTGNNERVCVVARSGDFGMLPLTSGTWSSAANFSVVLTKYTAFRQLVFILTNVTVSNNGAQMFVRVSTDGGSTYDSAAASYNWAQDGWNTSGTSNQNHNNSDIFIALTGSGTTGATGGLSNVAATSGAFTLYLPNQTSTAVRPLIYGTAGYHMGSDTGDYDTFVGERLTAQDTDGLQFSVDVGTFSGSYEVFGIP